MSLWDPHQQYLTDSIEMVQWRAANVVYVVTLTNGSHWYNVCLPKINVISCLPY